MSGIGGILAGVGGGGRPLATAIVHPVNILSLRGALAGAEAGLIAPVLIGPSFRIRALAEEAGADIAALPLIDVPDGRAAAEHAVALARSGQVGLLMKGHLHTREMMQAVVSPRTGLRTGQRISHVYLMEVANYPRPLLLTDAAINIAPTLAEKAQIIQNAIDLAHRIGIAQPRVAILAAVETVSCRLPSTVDAAALCKMSERGQITGGVLDGPLGLDTAVDEAAAAEKEIVSDVAGRADILMVSEIEAGNMLVKQLSFLSGARAAGIVVGASVPLILTSRSDSVGTRLASCALGVLVARAHGTE